jgi:hypothetical protein
MICKTSNRNTLVENIKRDKVFIPRMGIPLDSLLPILTPPIAIIHNIGVTFSAFNTTRLTKGPEGHFRCRLSYFQLFPEVTERVKDAL